MVVNEHGVFANVSAPLVRNGEIKATLIATVSTDALSEMVEALDAGTGTAFILSDTGRVIAYSDRDRVGTEDLERRPLPRPVSLFGDAVLEVLFQTPTMAPFDAARQAGVDGLCRCAYSGEFDFVDTHMYWPITHMVAPAKDAVKCGEYHSPGGRLAGIDGVYIPGADPLSPATKFGLAIFLFVLAGILGHMAVRAVRCGRSKGHS
ncbi:hypothetical protein [Breoghania sp.]|uniref:hypothetical protein n=1 Tax=Breoghania sp. TaxID=2065378 RepID=UPI00262596F7|nr:hypothetical protein [Breoghania sp.]MDJ0932837.1 hypothetical protein [Breoghania sp.]